MKIYLMYNISAALFRTFEKHLCSSQFPLPAELGLSQSGQDKQLSWKVWSTLRVWAFIIDKKVLESYIILLYLQIYSYTKMKHTINGRTAEVTVEMTQNETVRIIG